MAVKIYHGDILFTPSADRLEIHENSYIIVEEGVVSQICEKIPEQYQGAEVVDYGDKLIIPAFSDLHVHGAQYVQRGIGMDCLLSDWLNHYTFPQESRFQNIRQTPRFSLWRIPQSAMVLSMPMFLQPFTVRPQTISLIKWKRKVCMVMWEK